MATVLARGQRSVPRFSLGRRDRCGRRGKMVRCGRRVDSISFIHAGVHSLFTKELGVFTGVSAGSVEDVGKTAQVRAGCGAFSICPELHRLLLEMWTGTQTEAIEGLVINFHFSSGNYGDYGERYMTHVRKTQCPSHRASGELGHMPHSPRSASRGGRRPEPSMTPQRDSGQCFHAFGHVFHAHRGCKDEYNQEQAGSSRIREALCCCRVWPA
jgi:hypothetical protein